MIRLKYSAETLLLFICILSLSCSNSPEKTEPIPVNSNTENYQVIVDSMFQFHPESIGIMVHIESPTHGISWSGNAGYSNIEKKTKLLSEQPALIASSIKTYISATILRLQEKGQLSIEDNISRYLSERTINLFSNNGYDFEDITIKHLLSHTSGIVDYANEEYINAIDSNKKHRWTRDEQLELTTKVGDPLGKPQDVFNYSDANFLLSTEIIETVTQKPFYKAVPELLKYDQLGFSHTWFPTLDEKPENTKELVHQYWSSRNWDSYDIDISVDLYGGGGIATTTKELAQFSYNLFTHNIIEDNNILKLLTTEVRTRDKKRSGYGLGLSMGSTKGFKRYGHGGFWGSQVMYFPKLNASIAVFVLEKDVKNKVIKGTIEKLVGELSNQIYLEEEKVTKDYQLYKAKNTKAILVLFPGGGNTAKETKEEFDIISLANANNISVVFMNFNRHLWIDEATKKQLSNSLEDIFSKNELGTKNVFIGGMSIGGNVALSLSDYLLQNESPILPNGVFMVDSPIDLYALYKSSIKDIANPEFDEERLAEPKWIVSYFEEEFSKESLLENIKKVSPFIHEHKYKSVSNLENTKLRFYTEPDSLWYKENRQTNFESTNAYAIQQISKQLQSNNWTKFELIETKNRGYRANGERHPHSWSIVDANELIEWIKE